MFVRARAQHSGQLSMGANTPCGSAVVAVLLCIAALGVDALSQTATHHVDGHEEPKPPVFPDVFHLKYTFSMPHFYLTQPNGLSYPVSVWYDGPNNRRRVEAYDGEDLQVSVGGYDFTVIPRIDQLDCDVWGEPGRQVYSPLPYMDLWEYGGTVDLGGRESYIWQRQIKEGNKVSQYTFYVTLDGVPLRLNMIGVNYLTNAHFDEYIYEFTHFQASLPNNASSLFTAPRICEAKLAQLREEEAQLQQQQQQQPGSAGDGEGADGTTSAGGSRARRQHPAAWQLGAALPDVRAYDHHRAYSLWSRAHGRVHADAGEWEARLERFRSTVQRVQAHNAARRQRGYSLRLNAWADWQPAEFEAAMLPNKRLSRGDGDAGTLRSELGGAYRPLGQLRANLTRQQLPASVDWRGTGADPGIKDQGMCGSCYAFAATGAMDGAWFVATGERRSFSEQQIVDCAWDYGPNGCFGGYYQPVFNYVAEGGGIALEQDYTYRGEVGWCRSANHTRVGRFSGYWNVESRDELALMEAVWKYGPVAVSVYADLENFRYFSEGVYDEPECSTKMRDLDHTVTLYGYGTTPEGKDYWLVRNSWAKYYGDDGYIRIARGQHDCGIATDPAVPAVEARFVRPEAQEAARRAAARWEDA